MWHNPYHDFAYSLGEPSGRTKAGKEVTCPLLTDSTGSLVPCVKMHFTCEWYTKILLSHPHCFFNRSRFEGLPLGRY